MGTAATPGPYMTNIKPCISSSRKIVVSTMVNIIAQHKEASWSGLASASHISSRQPFLHRITSKPVKFEKFVTRAMSEQSDNKPFSGLPIDLRGKRAFIAGVADDNGYGWAIAKSLAAAGAEILVGTWVPALNIFESSLRRGKFDESRILPDGSLMEITKVYPMDAVYDSPEDVPVDVETNKRYAGSSNWTVQELVECVKKDFGSIDILVHSLANGPEVSKPLLETSRNGYLAALSASSYSYISLLKHFLPIMNPGGASISLTYIASERIIPGYGGAFYDLRGKLQPFTVLRAYSSSEAVSSLCWQRSKPVIVNESTCAAETALLGGPVEDSVLMPDPLPSVTSSSLSVSTAISGGRSGPAEVSFLTSSSESVSSTGNLSSSMETPHRSHLWPGGTLTRLHAPHSKYNLKDDMDVFSPVVDVQPITPSLDKLWDIHEGAKKDHLLADKRPSSLLFPSSRRFAFADDGAGDHPIFDWKSSSMYQQDDKRSLTSLGSMPTPSSKSEEASITPPEAWGGDKISDKFAHLRHLPSRFGMEASGGLTTSSTYSGQTQSSMLSQTSISSLTSYDISYENLRTKDVSSSQETSLGFPEHLSSSMSALSLGSKGITGAGSLDSPKLASLGLPRRFSTYAERISTTSAFSDGTSQLVVSPKTKKTGAETREELLNSLLLRSDSFTGAESGILPAMNGGTQLHKAPQPDPQQGSNFTLQLFQRTLEETLDSFQKSIHGDMRNLHIEILRQFHMQEMEMSCVMRSILQNQAELMEEVKSLRKENQQLRQLL